MRGVLGRPAAALLVLLLAGPDIAPHSLSVSGERTASAAHDDGMAAMPMPPAAAAVAIAPASLAAAPPASATERVLVSFHPLLCRIVTDSTCRLPAAVKPAPTILRV